MWAVHENFEPLEYETEDGLKLVTVYYHYKDAVKALAEIADTIPNARIVKVSLHQEKE